MTLNPFPGKFLAVEGIDASGKSDQFVRLKNYLLAYCFDQSKLLFTKEADTDHESGKEIYQLLHGEHPTLKLNEINPWVMQARYFRNRIWHYANKVLPALKAGIHVVSDRSLASICFGVLSPEEFAPLLAIEEQAFLGAELPFIWPDKILIYDVSAEVARKHMTEQQKKLDEFEKDMGFQMRVRQNYLEFARRYPNCHVINGSGKPEDVFRETKRIVVEFFGLSK